MISYYVGEVKSYDVRGIECLHINYFDTYKWASNFLACVRTSTINSDKSWSRDWYVAMNHHCSVILVHTCTINCNDVEVKKCLRNYNVIKVKGKNVEGVGCFA